MIKGIDHLIIVVKDLDQAAKDYEQLGFTVVPGGKHPVGSHNALISFRDGSYIEIIAFYREALDHRWWEPLAKGERFVDFCLQTDDLRGDTRKLRDAGVAIKDPYRGHARDRTAMSSNGCFRWRPAAIEAWRRF